MHDRRGSRRSALDGHEVQQLRTLEKIKPGHGMAAPLKVLGHDTTNIAQMPGDENAHHNRIALRA